MNATKRRACAPILLTALLLVWATGLTPSARSSEPSSDWHHLVGTKHDQSPAQKPTLGPLAAETTFATRPLSFEPLPREGEGLARFNARGRGYGLSVMPNEAELILWPSAATSATADRANGKASSPPASRLRMKLLGANVTSVAAGVEQLPATINRFVGSDSGLWRTKIPTYAKVRCEQVYPGVDLVYYGNERQLEFDFIVAPGSDPRQIRLGFEGADKMEIAPNGDLVLRLGDQELRQRKPLIYQSLNGARTELAGSFKLNDKHEAQFELAAYDRSRPLIIDPQLIYATYLGGSDSDGAEGVAVDALGNVYVVGWTFSSDFPVENAIQPTNALHSVPTIPVGSDVFVSKFRPDGSLVYSTYLGGPDDSYDLGNGIAVDANGDAYITGVAGSGRFPTTPGAFQTAKAGGQSDAFVAKISSDGSTLLYSTYLGGLRGTPNNTCCGGTDVGFSIGVDRAGNAFVCGFTASTDFPVTGGVFQPTHGGTGDHGINGINYLGDAFVTKLNSTGSQLIYSTFLGGVGDDVATDIAVDAAGQAYVTGATFSTNFPTAGIPFQADLHGMSDAFVAKINASGSALVYSTFLGGSGMENWNSINYAKRGIAVDTAGSAYVSGETGSADFPTTNSFQSVWHNLSAFVTKLAPDGSALVYSTYLGCDAESLAHGIAVDAAGQAHVTGSGRAGFPLVNPIQTSGAVFVTKLSADGTQMLYSTAIGGGDRPEGGRGIAVDAFGNAYVAGFTYALNFPTTPNAFQPTLADAAGNGGGDAFVAIIHSENEPPPPAPTIVAPGSFTVAADSGQCSARVRYDAHVENATRCVEFICDPPNGTDLELPIGATTVNCFAYDVTGGTSVYSFTITVQGVFRESPNFSTLDSGGGRSASPNYTMVSSLGGIGGTLTGPSPLVVIDCGYIGQLHAFPCF